MSEKRTRQAREARLIVGLSEIREDLRPLVKVRTPQGTVEHLAKRAGVAWATLCAKLIEETASVEEDDGARATVCPMCAADHRQIGQGTRYKRQDRS